MDITKKSVVKVVLVTLSILLNVVLGYWYMKTYVYQLGFQNGQQVLGQQVNMMIENGQLIVPGQEVVEE